MKPGENALVIRVTVVVAGYGKQSFTCLVVSCVLFVFSLFSTYRKRRWESGTIKHINLYFDAAYLHVTLEDSL